MLGQVHLFRYNEDGNMKFTLLYMYVNPTHEDKRKKENGDDCVERMVVKR